MDHLFEDTWELAEDTKQRVIPYLTGGDRDKDRVPWCKGKHQVSII